MSEVGALSIRITADGGQATRELDTVGKRVQQSGKQLRENANRWAKWGIAAAAAAGAVAAAMIKAQMKTIDELGKMSDQLGIATESLQALRHQAELTGVGSENLTVNLERMSRRLGQAARDGGRTADTISDLGLNLDDLSKMTVDQQLDSLAQAMSGVTNQGERAAIANDLFGRSGQRMLLMLDSMEDGLDPVLQGLDEMGNLLSREEVAMVEAANDAITEAGTALNTVWQRAAVEVAPIIKAIADEIVNASKDMGGFGDTSLKVFDGVVKGAGIAGDALRGWQLIIQGLRAGFYGFGVFVIDLFAGVVEGLNSLMQGAADGVNVLIRQMNRIPKVNIKEIIVGDSEMAQNLRITANNMRLDFNDAMFDMRSNAARPLPSEQIDNFVENVREGARVAAEEMGNISSPSAGADDDSPASQFSRDENEEWLEKLRERYMTEAELQIEAHEGELERLQELKQQELLTEQEYENERERMAMSHAESMASIQEQERRQRVGIMSGMMNNLSQLMNTGSKKMFAIGKAAAIANALLQGKEAVVSSYAAGARIGGPPVGAAFAATAAVATMAQINQIKSSSFGGAGGGANTFAGGVPAVRTTDAGNTGPQQPGQTVDINIAGSGNSFSIDQVRTLIQQINEQSGDGVNIAFNG